MEKLFEVLISLFDSDQKNQIKASSDYSTLEMSLNYMEPSQCMTPQRYGTSDAADIVSGENQEIRDQTCEDDLRAMIKKKGITKLTAELKDATNDTDDSISEEEHIRTDSTGTIHTELKIVEEEEEYDFRTDTDEEENEEEPDEDTDENDGTDQDIYSIHKVFAFLQEENMCSLQDKPGIAGSWILLYSQWKMYSQIRNY